MSSMPSLHPHCGLRPYLPRACPHFVMPCAVCPQPILVRFAGMHNHLACQDRIFGANNRAAQELVGGGRHAHLCVFVGTVLCVLCAFTSCISVRGSIHVNVSVCVCVLCRSVCILCDKELHGCAACPDGLGSTYTSSCMQTLRAHTHMPLPLLDDEDHGCAVLTMRTMGVLF